jgi:prepilin-type N-terminal cleavage/methylation domain-containing protein
MRRGERSGHATGESPDDAGFALLELLVVLFILGGLGALAAFGAGAFKGSSSASPSGGTPAPSGSQSLASEASATAVPACNDDVKIVETAVTAFEAVNNGAVPTFGELTGKGHGGPYLVGYSRSEYFSISVDANGNVMVTLGRADPAAIAPHLYPTTKAPFTGFPVNYDTWSWSDATTAGVAYSGNADVCAGA